MALVALVGGGGFMRWYQAPTRNSVPLFTRTTSDGVLIEAQRGDVLTTRLLCADGALQCSQRELGVRMRFALDDNEPRGGMAFADSSRPKPTECAPGDGRPAVRVITTAGLGHPPGSVDEMFILAVTSPGVATVRATRTDGTADEMTPVDNLAVLATRTGFDPTAPVQAFDSNSQPTTVC